MTAKHFQRAPGDVLKVTAPSALSARQLVSLGLIIGISTDDFDSGDTAHLIVKGKCSFAKKVSGFACVAGEPLYLETIPVGETDAGDLRVTPEPVGDIVAVCTQAATAAEATVEGFLLPPSLRGMAGLVSFVAFFDASIAANQTIGAHTFGPTFKTGDVLFDGHVDVLDTFTSAGDLATIAIHLDAADDVVAAVAINAANPGPYDQGLRDIIPSGKVANVTEPLGAGAQLTATVAVEALTAGSFVVVGRIF